MKAKCINDKSEEYSNFKDKTNPNKVIGLTKDKLYEAEQSKEYEGYFDVINDLGIKESYKKERFEVMECINKDCNFNIDNVCKHKVISNTCVECDKRIKLQHTQSYAEEQLEYAMEKEAKIKNALMVECIDNEEYSDRLTLGKTYPVIEDEEEYYVVKDDKGEEENYYKSRFKIVEQSMPINYEEEYKKLKDENKDLKERLGNQCESIESYIKENEWLKELSVARGENNKKYENEIKELKSSLHDVIEQNNNYGYLLENYRGLLKIAQGLAEANKWLVCNRLYVEGLED